MIFYLQLFTEMFVFYLFLVAAAITYTFTCTFAVTAFTDI